MRTWVWLHGCMTVAQVVAKVSVVYATSAAGDLPSCTVLSAVLAYQDERFLPGMQAQWSL